MEAAIRFSRNSTPGTEQRFLRVDVSGKAFSLCRFTEHSRREPKYEVLHSTVKVPSFRAFDWHPINEDLVVVGQAGGDATLLNIAGSPQDALPFSVRSQRLCNAVALNSENLLAAGLDKVRTDFCLNVWDFNQRLPGPGSKEFSKSTTEPLHKLASGEPITSLKFFHDDPQLLVAGVKGQYVRLYDLREPTVSNGLQFATRCVHNLAIDWLDQNYFASCYPANDPSLCVWDRRMISRIHSPSMSFTGGPGEPQHESRQPEVSLELKNVIDSPGSIWSVRFSKAKRGQLGVLSSTGHLKTYQIGKDFASETHPNDLNGSNYLSWETSQPQNVFLERSQEVAKRASQSSVASDDKSRCVSFDFLTSTTKSGEGRMLVLDGYGKVKVVSTRPPPEPSTLMWAGVFCKGEDLVSPSLSDDSSPADVLGRIRSRAQSRNALRRTLKEQRPNKSMADKKRMSNMENQAWHADLGYFETDMSLEDVLTLASTQKLRCEAGYLLNPSANKMVVSDSSWTQSFWSWVERAATISRNGNMIQDNFDLSYMGIYGLWMEEITTKNRILGPSSNKPAKIIDNLVRRLNLPSIKGCVTEYAANRQICLHTTGLAWSPEELEMRVKRLVSWKNHSKAAALALFATERKLAYMALRDEHATSSHKTLALAIAGAVKKMDNGSNVRPAGESDSDDAWASSISALAEELNDPFARAILAYVKTGDWTNVVSEEALPLKYRLCVALRHFDDAQLTHYISQATKEALAQGNLEGVVLTGTASPDAFDLMSAYLKRFGDVQTTVLALCPSIPRYLDDESVVRKFNAWKNAYRALMDSWDLRFDRVRFDLAYQSAAVDETGRRLIQPAKQQVRLVCGFCAQKVAHMAGGSGSEAHVVETTQNPLTKGKAAAIGTVCPKCGRHLPRCGVCDLWLGVPDESYLPWYGPKDALKASSGNFGLDMTASVAGSIQTTIGPGAGPRKLRAGASPSTITSEPQHVQLKSLAGTDAPGRPAVQASGPAMHDGQLMPNTAVVSADVDDEEHHAQAARSWEMAMSRFTVLCMKCSHGCHAVHARMWFDQHQICPVPECQCVCNE